MAYSFQIFTLNQILTAAQMNQVEVNIRDHVHGDDGVSGGVATQAEQETATSLLKTVSPGRQQYHPSAAKAWVQFDNVGAGTINASYNITSIVEVGVGVATVNWATNFSSVNYVVVGTVGSPGAGFLSVTALAVGSVEIRTFDQAGAAANMAGYNVAAYGDQ